MRPRIYSGEKETIFDHLAAGIISAVAMFATSAVGPVIATVRAGGTSPGSVLLIYRGMYIWGIVAVAVGFIAGLILGPRRMAQLFGYLWGTEDPENRALTTTLRVGLAALIAVGLVLSW